MREKHFNTKIITYRDGRSKYVYANRDIFIEKEETETPTPKIPTDTTAPKKPKERKAQDKDIERAIVRARNKVYDLVYENDFTHFYTLTFNQNKYNSKEAKEILEKTQNFLHHAVERKDLKYVLTAERHKNGGIHLHLVANCPFQLVDSDTRMVKGYSKPLKLSTIKKKNIPQEDILKNVYNVPEWQYGFTTAIEINGDPAALAQYLTKYITKDIHKIFGKYYWSSKNLIRSPKVTYTNTPDYQEINSPEYTLSFGLSLKYKSDFSKLE